MRSGLLLTLGFFLACSFIPVSADTDVFFVIRSAKPRDNLDRRTEAWISGSLKRLFMRWSPESRFVDLPMSNLEDLPTALQQELSPGERIRGLSFLGHGSPSTFVLSGQESLFARDFDRILSRVLKNLPISKDLLVYFNSCVSFQRNEHPEDTGFEVELFRRLTDTLKAQNSKPENLFLIGHMGVAGFGGFLPRLPSDWILRHLRVRLPNTVISQADIRRQIQSLLIVGSILGFSPLLIEAMQLPTTEFTTGFKLAYLGGSLAILGAGFISYWNYISKFGRSLHMGPNGEFTDRELHVRAALHEASRSSSCKMSLIDLLKTKIFKQDKNAKID